MTSSADTSSAEIRRRFIQFFKDREHRPVASSPLVPANDATLLFTNAGMVQFKDVFLGEDQRDYRRAVTAQRCVRAGGKHNDLENVGYTARHHTFFEMLGNFSFGDYFKAEAIRFAWDLLTDGYRLPAEKLWVTVYASDDEAYAIWADAIGVPPQRIVRIGDKPGKRHDSDNFWAMGDTGPCGPCSEIFYDHGPDVAGGPPGSPDEDGDRYIEIWNLVFMQYNRGADGEMTPLPAPSVDTGMGLERLAAVLQGVHSNYDIDLFQTLIRAAAELTGCDDLQHSSLKVLADHVRSSAFLIVDGVLPSNEGRGYVLRRIVRRAIRHGHKLGAKGLFFNRLVAPLVAEMGDAYPELAAAEAQVTAALAQEETRFAETLDNGMALLEASIESLGDERTIPGDTVFKLYDTYGFPVDLTADVARERGLDVDQQGFDRAMAEQQRRSRDASQFGAGGGAKLTLDADAATDFLGYDGVSGSAPLAALFRDGSPVDRLETGEEGVAVLPATPFYAESGGQIGDAGELTTADGRFRVEDTRKQGRTFLHIGRVVDGALEVGAQTRAEVDAARRQATALNHSATHLLHAALRRVLGTHVQQKGSLVDAERLRFDFSHGAPLSDAELQRIERLVNEQIRANAEVETRLMNQQDAIKAGALALFGEKYDDQVRVLSMGDFSTELCGGTHVRRLGDIGLFKITGESGIASGVRRIEALTGDAALRHVENLQRRLDEVAALLKGDSADVDARVRQLLERVKKQDKDLQQLKQKLASGQSEDLSAQAVDVGGLQVLAAQLDGAANDAGDLRAAVDRYRDRLRSAAVVLAAVDGDDVRLVAGVTKDRTAQIKAGDLLKQVAGAIGGRGGGRPDMAQGGGGDPKKLAAALRAVPDWVRARLNDA